MDWRKYICWYPKRLLLFFTISLFNWIWLSSQMMMPMYLRGNQNTSAFLLEKSSVNYFPKTEEADWASLQRKEGQFVRCRSTEGAKYQWHLLSTDRSGAEKPPFVQVKGGSLAQLSGVSPLSTGYYLTLKAARNLHLCTNNPWKEFKKGGNHNEIDKTQWSCRKEWHL